MVAEVVRGRTVKRYPRPGIHTQGTEQQICRVISEYQSAYPDPLVVSVGDNLTVSEKESAWSGWVWCTNQDGKSGWVPESYVEWKGNACVALCDYDATELSVRVGEELVVGKEESGWLWCTSQEGQSGWVPAENLERL
jgi:hypothetical protein